MAGGTVSSGTSTYTGTVTTAGTAETTTFADRYGYVLIQNSGTNPIWVTADGSAPTGSGAGSGVEVPAGESAVLANGLALWYQSSKVITAGTAQIPQGSGFYVSTSSTVTSTPGNPGHENPFMSSGAGQMTNPGTKVEVIAPTGTPTYTISGTG